MIKICNRFLKFFKLFIVLNPLFFVLSFCNFDIEFKENKFTPMKILLAIISKEENRILLKYAKTASSCLMRSGQFKVDYKRWQKISTKAKIQELSEINYDLVIFVNINKEKNIEFRIYDTFDVQMLDGKKLQFTKKDSDAYVLADQIWRCLTNSASSFLSKIAFIENNNKLSKEKVSICYCDFDGSNLKNLVNSNSNCVGLYWSTNAKEMRLFCSEFTHKNVRLISISELGRKRSLFNFDGTCVGLSLSCDNNQALYCRSGDIWYCKYDVEDKIAIHKKLISNDGKNFSPILLSNGNIIFCSDSRELGLRNKKHFSGPQIYYYNSKNKTSKLITSGGYCVSPSYKKGKLVYSKKVNGYFQLFIYDFKSKVHKQITFGNSNKIDSSWSPCGNFIVFCCKSNGKSRIAVVDLIFNRIKFLTNTNDFCHSPAWSPNYYKIN